VHCHGGSFGSIPGLRWVQHRLIDRPVWQHRETVNVGIGIIGIEIQSIFKELAYISEQNRLIEAISHSENGAYPQSKIQELLDDWLNIARTNRIYDQIRWLDSSGQERLRVNYNNGEPISIPTSNLQNKSKRYYFKNTIKLNKGEIFISPLDLNRENGKIEKPFKPMIRIGTPVFDNKGQKKGIVILNFLGQSLLNKLDNMMKAAGSQEWLVDRKGYWLKGSHKDLEWGFMFNRPKATISNHYPNAWNKIRTTQQGQFENDMGLWTYATIYPLFEGQLSSNELTQIENISEIDYQDYFWKVVLYLPRTEYKALMWKTGLNFTVTMLVLIIILFSGTWHLANAWVREQRAEEELRQINLNLEKTVQQRTLELRNEIKERHNVELELREREERFRSITTTSSVAIFITIDHLGKVITWNPTAEKIFGYKEEEALGKPLTNYMPERYRTAHSKGIERVLNTNEYHLIGKTVEVHGLKKSGDEFPIELSLGTWEQGKTRYFSAVIHDITKRKQAEQKLKHLATHDNLTGLPNRNLCIDRLDHALANASRNNEQIAVLFIDLDGFKLVNDTISHEAGDKLLVEVSTRLEESVRKMDTVSRLGGDEFIIVLVDIDAKTNVQIISEKLITSIGKPFVIDGIPVNIGASIGIALYPNHGQNSELLIKEADAAMYSIKKHGKNNYAFAQV